MPMEFPDWSTLPRITEDAAEHLAARDDNDDWAAVVGYDFTDDLLEPTQYSRIVFYSCVLGHDALSGAALSNVAFVDCEFTNADFAETELNNCIFERCLLITAGFAGSTLHCVTFAGCDLRRATFTCCDLYSCAFIGCPRSSTPLPGLPDLGLRTTLTHAVFSQVRFDRLDFDNCDMEYIDFTESRGGVIALTNCITNDLPNPRQAEVWEDLPVADVDHPDQE